MKKLNSKSGQKNSLPYIWNNKKTKRAFLSSGLAKVDVLTEAISSLNFVNRKQYKLLLDTFGFYFFSRISGLSDLATFVNRSSIWRF